MESRNERKRVVLSSILGITLVFQLCAAPTALGEVYDGGVTYEVTTITDIFASIDGEGTVVNFNANFGGYVYVGYNSPGATLNFGSGARAAYISVDRDCWANFNGGSVGIALSVSQGAQVMIRGERFEVVDRAGTRQYDPGTTLYVAYAIVTAYGAGNEPLFTGRVSCASGATVLLGGEAKDLGLEVQIDVKPGSNPSIINLRSNGMVPVAVLSDPDKAFDATQVLPGTVEFAGAGVAVSRSGKYMAHTEDVDEDGDVDMLLHFRTSDLKLENGVTEAAVELTGQVGGPAAVRSAGLTNDRMPISGTDKVYILKPKKKSAH